MPPIHSAHDGRYGVVLNSSRLARRDWIVPIVGTSKPQRLEENAAAASLQLSSSTLQALEEIFPLGAVAGERTVPELLPRLGL
jgi:diketogulonate reductase-like aldo/keto reductase